jgi:hypothetical protein
LEQHGKFPTKLDGRDYITKDKAIDKYDKIDADLKENLPEDI